MNGGVRKGWGPVDTSKTERLEHGVARQSHKRHVSPLSRPIKAKVSLCMLSVVSIRSPSPCPASARRPSPPRRGYQRHFDFECLLCNHHFRERAWRAAQTSAFGARKTAVHTTARIGRVQWRCFGYPWVIREPNCTSTMHDFD